MSIEGWVCIISTIFLIIILIKAKIIYLFLKKNNIYITANTIKLCAFLIFGIFIGVAIYLADQSFRKELSHRHEKIIEEIIEQDRKNDEKLIEASKNEEILFQKWDYDTSVDEMTDKKIYWASCKSNNTEYLKFPYEGGTKCTLTIRNMNGKNNIYITINKGQLQTYDEYALIRMDDKKAQKYSLIGSNDGDSKFAFISNENTLISQIKKSSIIKIQLPFYGNGRITFTFEPGNLEWKY